MDIGSKLKNSRSKAGLTQEQVVAYLVIWAMCLIWFWMGAESIDAMGYSLLVFYLVLPISTFVISLIIGKDTGWGKSKWFMVLFFGVMYMLACYGTFSLANAIAFDKVNYPELGDMIPGVVIATIGMGIGSFMQWLKSKRR